MISKNKGEEAKALAEIYGIDSAAERMGLSVDSLKRYIRTTYGTTKERPNVFIFDIETAPLKGWLWGVWNQNVSPEQIIEDWSIIGWSGKWLFEPEVYSDILTPDEAIRRDDKRIMQSLYEYIDHTDVLIGHNIKHFDIKRINTRFLVHHLPPPSPYKVVDTKEVMKKHFAFMHNRLDYANKVLGLSRKLETGGFSLWPTCLDGDKKALKSMQEYNMHDVGCAEELYVALRGWVKSHPNMGMFVEGNGVSCANCGGHDLEYAGWYYADINKYKSYRCLDPKCGAINRVRTGSGKKTKLISVAR